MFVPKTFAHLCNAMQTRAVVRIDDKEGVINGISVEDGSGLTYIVTLQPQGKSNTLADALLTPIKVYFRVVS